MDANTRKAIELLGQHTRNQFDIWMLAGDSNGSARALIMAALMGVPKIAKSKAGVNAIRSEFYKQLAIDGETENQRETRFHLSCSALFVGGAA